MTRTDVSFTVDGEQCAAWLYLPEGETARFPAVVMAHGLGAVRTMRLDRIAESFCKAGYACLVFDYLRTGDSSGEPRQVVSVLSQGREWSAAVEFVRALAEVDPERVALWGTSMGGGHAIMHASSDPRIAAVLLHSPFTDGLRAAVQTPPAQAIGPLSYALRDGLRRLTRPAAPLMIPIASRDGETALIAEPDALAQLERLMPSGVDIVNELAARVILELPRFRPIRHIGRIKAPVFFAAGTRDAMVPPEAVRRAASRVGRAEVHEYDAGHFDMFDEARIDQLLADQVAFLKRHVPT